MLACSIYQPKAMKEGRRKEASESKREGERKGKRDKSYMFSLIYFVHT